MKEIRELFNWEKSERGEPVKFNVLLPNTPQTTTQNYKRFRKHVDLDEDCWINLNGLKYELGCKTLSQTIRVLIRRERGRQEGVVKKI